MASVQVNGRGFTASWNLTAKYCDSCKSAPALLYCRSDSAFLCSGCDSKVHGANKLASRHERVWMCEVCEQAPASFTCKADAAALCVTCDRDIHSANPLARRHERFPVIPFYDSPPSSVKSNAGNFLVPNSFLKDDEDHNDEEETDGYGEEAEAASWILQNPNSKLLETPDLKCENYFFTDVDPCIDLDYASSMDSSLQHHNSTGTDSVVPVQNKIPINPLLMNPSFDNCIDMDFYRSKPSFSYSTKSFTQSVSSSSLDFGVVPDGNSNAMADISNPFDKSMKGGLDLSETTATTANQASQLSGLDREARVLRYREKRKNRKFEKTIRYASRKAYAETRPRIKGRFAKRTDIEADMDRIYSSTSNLFADSGYGIVPSF